MVALWGLAGLLMIWPNGVNAGCVISRCAAPIVNIGAPSEGAAFRAGQDITISGRAFGNVV